MAARKSRVHPSLTWKPKGKGLEIQSALPNRQLGAVLIVYKFEPHRSGGDVILYRRGESDWERLTLLSGKDYHGEVLRYAFSSDGEALGYVYWKHDTLRLECHKLASAEPTLRAELPWPEGNPKTPDVWPERVALAVHPSGERAVVSLLFTQRAVRTSHEVDAGVPERVGKPRRFLCELTAKGSSALPQDASRTPTGLGFVGEDLVVVYETGQVELRSAAGTVRSESGLSDPQILAQTGDELLLCADKTLIRWQVTAGRASDRWTLPFAPHAACLREQGFRAVRVRSRLLESCDENGPAAGRELPEEAASIAVVPDGQLVHASSHAVHIWDRESFEKLPEIDEGALVGSLVESGARVEAIVSELAPEGPGALARVLAQVWSEARARKMYGSFLNLSRDVAERRAELAAQEGRVADASVDLLFAATAHHDKKEGEARAAVRARADAMIARHLSAPCPPTEDLAVAHLLSILERGMTGPGDELAVRFGRAVLAVPELASPTFVLLFGVFQALEWLSSISFLDLAGWEHSIARANAAQEDAITYLTRAAELFPDAKLPRVWLYTLASGRGTLAGDASFAPRVLAELRRCKALGPEEVAGFLDRQARNYGASWYLATKGWRSVLKGK